VVYKAPKLLEARTGSATIVATSVFDPAKVVEIPISIAPLTVVNVTPFSDPYIVSIGSTTNFAAAVVNGNATGVEQSVTWLLTGPNGEANTSNRYGIISRTGVYTAPAVVPAPDGRCRITVTSLYDPQSKRVINIRIVAGSISVGID
jgi:hypothetical protein